MKLKRLTSLLTAAALSLCAVQVPVFAEDAAVEEGIEILLDYCDGTYTTETITRYVDEPYGELPVPTRTGYTFVDWSKTFPVYAESADGNASVSIWNPVNAEDIVDGTVDILYAVWDANSYNITFDVSGFGHSASTGNDMQTITVDYDDPITIPEITWERAVAFQHWKTADGIIMDGYDTYSMEELGLAAADVTFTPSCVLYVSARVYYEANGGEVDAADGQVYYGNETLGYYGDLPIPTREGCRFLGWYTEASGGSRITEASNVYETMQVCGMTGTITLYAHWEEVTGAVMGDVDLNGAVDIMDVILLNKSLLGSVQLNESQTLCSDCDGDGVPGSMDSLYIMMYIVELVESLPVIK